MLIYGGEEIREYLCKLLNKIWEAKRIPIEWNKTNGLLVKLSKKGDLSCCENWRGISLLPIASKIFCRVILNIMKDAFDKVLRNEQAGFRSSRNSTDQIATLRIIAEQSVE